MKVHTTNETTGKNPTGSNVLNYRTPTDQSSNRFLRVGKFAALLAAVGLLATGWQVTRIARRAFPNRGNAGNAMAEPSPSLPGNLAEFYRSSISPVLDAALERNRRAADRAIATLHERFNAHRAGVKPFAKDVSAWGTRLGVIERFATDQWDRHWRGNPNANRVADYIQEKFRVHVISEQSLQQDLAEALKQFRDDLEASRNQLYAEIKLPLHDSRSPIILDEMGWESLCKDATAHARGMNATVPRDSVATGLAALGGGWIGTEATEGIIAHILVRVGGGVAMEAAETATAAGGTAMVGGTATGGGLGSFGGPAGTVIGVGAGLAVGAAMDWWMTDRFTVQLTDQCDRFLDTIERQIVDGNAQSHGLQASFEQAVRLMDAGQRSAIIDALTEARN